MYIGIAIGFVVGITLGFVFFKKEHSLFSKEEARIFGEKGRKSQQERVLRRKERILALAVKKGKIVNDDAEDLFCISDSTAYRYLRELVNEGELEKHGEGKETYYIPV